MTIKEKLQMELEGLLENGPINIVIFGDSVSHGAMEGCYDYENVYWNRLRKMLNAYRDYVPVNMINASVAGTTAHGSLPRLDSQVLVHKPDLVIVCFGLNDVNFELEEYLTALRDIFTRCQQAGTQVVFLTPNMLNTRVIPEKTSPYFLDYAYKTAEMQNSGRMDNHIYSAVALAKELGVPVCDCYSKWKKLAETQDTTELLVNYINHPTPEMHALFAESLYEMLIGEEQSGKESDSSMISDAG